MAWVLANQHPAAAPAFPDGTAAAAAPPPPRALEEIIETRKKEIEQYNEKLPELREKLLALQAKAEQLTERWQIHERRDLEEEADALRVLIDDVRNGTLKEQYDAKTRPFLDALREAAAAPSESSPSSSLGEPSRAESRVPPPPLAAKKPRRARRKHPNTSREIRTSASSAEMSIRDEFLSDSASRPACADLEGGGGEEPVAAPSTVFLAASHVCAACGEGTLRKQTTESVMVCDLCGEASTLLESTTQTLGYNDDSATDMMQSFSYKRENHFLEWLNCTQAKESTEIPTDVLQDVMALLYEQRIARPDILPEHVRNCLKQLRLRKHYENTQLIHSLITGRAAPRFTAEQESKLRQMFLLIQQPFEEHVAAVEPRRKNFLSYSYILNKFCQLLGLNQFLPSFALLKGAEKLSRQDALWRRICEDPRVNWEFCPSS